MMRKGVMVMAACVVLCCGASDVYAGGSEPEPFDPIGALVPLDSKTPVQLKRAAILVSTAPWRDYARPEVQTPDNMFDPNGRSNFIYRYSSSASYTLFNPTDKPLTVEAVVPVGYDKHSPKLMSDDDDEEPLPMQILVDGKLAKTKLIKPPKGARWAERSVRLVDSLSFTITLPAKGQAVVLVEHGFDYFGNTHNIRSSRSFDFLGGTLTFATRGVALWSGAIDELRVELRLHEMAPFMYGIPPQFEPESRSVHIVRDEEGEHLESRLVISLKDTDYKDDIIIDMDHSLDPKGTPCNYPGFSLYSALDAKLHSIDVEHLKNMLLMNDGDALKHCERAIYARYGYNFEDEQDRRAFYKPPKHIKGRKIVYPAPNAAFDARMINLIEQELIRFIKAHIKNSGVTEP